MQQDKAYEKELAGRPLDGALILEASDAYKHIDTSAQKYTQTVGYQKYARAYSSVYTRIDAAYVQPGKAFKVSDVQAISEQDANSYYDISEKQNRANLSNNYLYSESDVEKVMELDAGVQKPFIMEYKDGIKWCALWEIWCAQCYFYSPFMALEGTKFHRIGGSDCWTSVPSGDTIY